jgi:hypothetical protein
MKFLLRNEAFSFETLRSAGFATGSMVLWQRDATARRDSWPRNAREGQS